MAKKIFPYEFKDVFDTQNDDKKIIPGLVSVGPKGYVYPESYKDIAANIYNMDLRPSDVFVFSFPRSGTTWTQELVWLVVNDLDYETASRIPLTERYVFLEFSMAFDDATKKLLYESNKDEGKLQEIEKLLKPGTEVLASTPSPRFIKSHLPLSLLPSNALETKMVHVARDPRDAIVSFYYLMNSMKLAQQETDFKKFWNLAINNLQIWMPYFENVKEAWDKRDHPNLLFLFYEDLKKDLPGSVRRVCEFFGKTYSDDQIERLVDHLKFENFKKNPSVNYDLIKEIGLMYTDKDFIRQGKTGGWREHFDEEMTAQAEQWMADNLRDTDLRFPHLQ